MKKNFYYSNKFPKISEFNNKYYKTILINFIILIIFSLLILQVLKLFEILIYCGIFLFFLVSAIRIELVKSLIIKRIDNILQENKALSKLGETYRDLLSGNGITYISYRKRERFIRVIIIISLLLLFLFIDNQNNKFYITWTYSFFTLTALLFVSSHNIYKYFFKLIESSFEKTGFQKYFSDSSLQRDQILSRLQHKIKRLKTLQLLAFYPAAIISFILIFFKRQADIVYMPIVLLVTLGIVVLDINKIVKIILPMLGQYDSSIKNKLGIKVKE